MIEVNYPTSKNDPHFEVMEEEANGTLSPITGELYRDRDDAEAEYVDFVLDTISMKVRLITHETVYFAHCVVCGSHPHHVDYPYPEWHAVTDEIADFPGWQATDEQHVFCPAHRPSKED